MTKKNFSNTYDNARPHEFYWKHGGNNVILTGNFDEWKQTIVMKPDTIDRSVFKATVKLDPYQTWSFKYLVDGVWRCSLDFPTETDSNGVVNNVLYPLDSSLDRQDGFESAPAPKISRNVRR